MRRWWWLIGPRWIGRDWSPEERRTVWLIHSIGMPLFAVACYETVMSLFAAGAPPAVAAAVGVGPPFVASLYVARGVVAWVKPELVKRADENAARRPAGEQAVQS